MELKDAIRKRQSIRAFKPDPVPRDILVKIMEDAIWAPSWGNTQPWEFSIVGGDTAKRLGEEFSNNYLNKVPDNPDIGMPEQWPDSNMSRYREVGKGLFETLSIGRGDKEKRGQHYVNMFRFFGAPNVIYIYIDKELGTYSVLDVGIITQNISLLATDYSLGTCIEAAAVRYPDIVRKHLNIPNSKKIVLGIAIGYPNWDSPYNKFRSNKENLDALVKWVDV
ncbi:MAG: nitroreductase [Deltaproteobacteria bacterium]|jgi:nitroreductase|nr:MAG: nitroreductase [Deltaproteobacteria bacterium]